MGATRKIKQNEDFRAQLRGVGLKVTQPRLAILRELRTLKTPISHAELAERLAGTEGLDRVTVWRVLVALTEAGLVDRQDVGDRTWRFELRAAGSIGHASHPHFMCTSCKSVRCLTPDAVKIAPRLGRNVTEIQLKGRCENCA